MHHVPLLREPIGLHHLQVAVVPLVGMAGEEEGLGGLVEDAGAVVGDPGFGEDGVVLGEGPVVILQGGVGEGQFLADADLEGGIGGVFQGSQVSLDGSLIVTSGAKGVADPFPEVGRDLGPALQVGPVVVGGGEGIACVDQGLCQEEVDLGDQRRVGETVEELAEGLGGGAVGLVLQVGLPQAEEGVGGRLVVGSDLKGCVKG